MEVDRRLEKAATQPGTRILAVYNRLLDDKDKPVGVTVCFKGQQPQTMLVGDKLTITYEVVESNGIIELEGPPVDG